MRFAFDQEQRQFAATLREFLERECTGKDVRSYAGGDRTRSADRWRGLAEMGVVGLTAPVEHGGLGMDEIGLVLLIEEAGRVVLPEPLVQVTAVGIPLLRDAAPNPVGERWLPKAARGEIKIGVGVGPTPFVADGEDVDVLILERRGSIHVLPRDEVTLTPVFSVDPTRSLSTVEWEATDGSLLLGGETGRAAAEL
ncbi:MAG TPA: acyl-CoA dehydrogenase family protein, partial [Actinomycetota bacterium]